MEAWWVADTIKREQNKYPFEDVAIFYRTNSQSRLIEDSLRHQNIPYQIYGAVKFYDRVEIKDLMAYIRLLMNPADDISFRRIVNIPTRGIGDKALAELQVFATERGVPLFAAARLALSEHHTKLTKKFGPFVQMIDEIIVTCTGQPMSDVVPVVSKRIEYPEYLKKKFPDQYRDKLDNVHELMNGIAQFETKNPGSKLADWLQAVTLVRDEVDDFTPGVSLMTLHMAKGLEYDRVYVVGVEEGILPHKSNVEDPMMLEEERRLFYVGMTRARKKLSISCVERRRNYNQIVENRPSRFIDEIPSKYLDVKSPPASAPVDSAYTYDYSPDGFEDRQFVKGDTVYHAAFGRGTVEDIDLSHGAPRAVVDFWEFGKRKVSLMQLRSVRDGLHSI
jgi:DNA helicase-2/ATP-dependent DNA helicase PcrA